jgi:hypothetical protein
MVMLVALFLLYRIAYPKTAKKGGDVPGKREIEGDDVVGKSRFVRPADSQPQTTPATSLNTVKQEEKAYIFAPGNGKAGAVIPPERLFDIFGDERTDDEPEPEDLDILPDEYETDESDSPDADEESEELRQVLGRETELADGFSIEEMETAAKAVNTPSDEHAEILYRVENTDMFEKLVSGDGEKRQLITEVIDRHVRGLNPDVTNEEESSETEYGSFNIADFLS